MKMYVGQRVRMGICPNETGTIVGIDGDSYQVRWDFGRVTTSGHKYLEIVPA